MKLTVIDTPGFGDQINNENWWRSAPFLAFSALFFSDLLFLLSLLFHSWQPIMKFINEQYEQYLQEEININRKKRIPDSRVHCCIYFIPPTGHWLVQIPFLYLHYFHLSCFRSLTYASTLALVYLWQPGKPLHMVNFVFGLLYSSENWCLNSQK